MKGVVSLERVVVGVLLVVVVVGAVVFLRSGSGSADPKPTGPTTAAAPDRKSTVAASRLPAEARTTIEAIQAGGGFADSRSGTVFENLDGLLPAEPDGFYHQFFVPGGPGTRRIVQSSGGVLYWSPDNFETFRQIDLDR